MVAPNDTAVLPWQTRTILDDLSAGETPFPLTELPAMKFAPLNQGKKRPIVWAFRLRDAGMETLKIEKRLHTTRSAYLRHIARTNGVTLARTRDIQGRQKKLDRVDGELRKAGF